ncbi:MAG: ATP-dependent helicase [Clostridia bacterium]|nr:ATP-dependent helicase [Clostridia bacterium]
MGLRKGQRELVEQYRGGYCAVPAIPGGGKTHCLSLWAVEMISQGLHRPGKILIVTYMNSAVNNFKQRISRELANRGIGSNKDYFVSTIHGLCLQIIKEKPDLVMANEDFDIVDGVTKIHIISSAIDEWRKKNEDIFRLYIEESNLSTSKIAETYKNWQDKLCSVMLAAISEFKCRGINPAEARENCKTLPKNSLLKHAADIYEIYNKKIKMSGFLDFDDMLYNAKRILSEDEMLLEKYRSKYTFVCEDEAQDSNLIQSEILTMIADGNLLRVGDSNQAICGSFTSSDFTLFKNFCDMPGTTVYNITQSSRNTKEIIDIANYFVNYVRERHPVPECRDSLLPQYIEPVGINDERPNPVNKEYGIRAAVLGSWEEEAEVVVREAYSMIKKHPDKTIAILIPSSWKISFVVKLLEAKNIPYEELDSTSGEKNKTVKKLGRVIDFISCPENSEKFAAVMNECFLIEEDKDDTDTDKEDGNSRAKNHKEQLIQYLKKLSTEKLLYPIGGEIDTRAVPEDLLKSKIWADFTEKLELVRELLEFPGTVVEKLILYIAEKLEFDREERAIAQKVAGDVRYLMSQDPHWRLVDLALELLSPKNIFNFFAGLVWDLKGYEPKPGVVTLATYHKSKGLEWDTVFLSGLNYADFPVELNDKFVGEYWFLKQEYKNPQALVKADIQKIFEGNPCLDSIMESKLETISEKARLLYVGITRAKQYLYLSGYHANKGKRNEVPASKYLVELKRYIDDNSKSESVNLEAGRGLSG